MDFDSQIYWVILAGGQATRMGGQDKGKILLNKRPLVDYLVSALTKKKANVIINANRHQEWYAQFAPVISDNLPDYLGPLAGMHAGLTQLNAAWIGFVPCDSPLLSDDFIARFYSAIQPHYQALIAHDGQHPQPTFALLRSSLLPQLTQFLAQGERKAQHFFRTCQTGYVDFSDQPNTFINLNTPQELAQLAQQLTHSTH